MPEPIDARVFRGVCFALLFEAAAFGTALIVRLAVL